MSEPSKQDVARLATIIRNSKIAEQPTDLIRTIINKYTTAIVDEMYLEIRKRDERIDELEAQLRNFTNN